MTDFTDDSSHDSSPDRAAIRLHLAELCEAVAVTEDEVATTCGHLAESRPRDAARLRARATVARQYATLERSRAARYRRASGGQIV